MPNSSTMEKVGCICVSLAGHDAGLIYVSVGEKNGKFLLADGKTRRLSNPKHKSYKHLSVLSDLPEEITERIAAGKADDAFIRRVIGEFSAKNII